MTTVADLAKQIAQFDGMVERAAPAAAKAVEAALQADLGAGKQPGGSAWKPTKKGGKRALVRAADHVKTKAVGTVIISEVTGDEHWFVHNKGTKSIAKRGLLPEAGIPAPVAMAITRAMNAEFSKTAGK